MQIDRAMRIVMAMSGKYDTGKTLIVKGKDAWSNPIEETVPEVDWERLEADLAAMKQIPD